MTWLKKAGEICVEFDKKAAGRPLALLGVAAKFSDNKAYAETIFKKALQVVNEVFFRQKNDFNEFLVLQVYGFMLKSLNREDEGEKLLEKSKIIQDNLFVWSERATQIYLPTWHLD